MKYLFILLIMTSCASKSSNAIEQLGEEVIKKKEGLDIRLTPIEEDKQK
jgi:hypothetical protein